MKIITQEEYDAFEVIDGIKYCPSGDYREIKNFHECCSFGERCKIENKYELNNLYQFHGFGSRQNSSLYVYDTKQGIIIRTGCFLGTSEDFRKAVTETHKDNNYAKEYFIICDLMEKKN
jgi:hypothetical protein